MSKGRRWLCIMISSVLFFLTAIPFSYGETACCQRDIGGVHKYTEISMDGTLPESACGVVAKLVKSPCPTGDLIATCTYEMGMSSMVKTDSGFRPGPVKAVKHQVNYYSDKGSTYEKRIEDCRKDCKAYEGQFSVVGDRKE